MHAPVKMCDQFTNGKQLYLNFTCLSLLVISKYLLKILKQKVKNILSTLTELLRSLQIQFLSTLSQCRIEELQKRRNCGFYRGLDTSQDSKSQATFLFVCFSFFERELLCVALAILELTLQTRLDLNSEIHLPQPPECWD